MAVRPAPGETLEETKFTRVLAGNEPGDRTRLPELWDFVETLNPTTDPSNPDYQFTLYRGTKAQKSDEKEWLGKFHERMNRDKIQSMFGGGQFNVWLKLRVGKGNALELKYNEDVKIGGEPRAAATAPGTSSSSSANDPLLRLLEIMDRRMAALESSTGSGAAAEGIRQAMALNGQVFSAAMPAVTETLRTIASPAAPAGPNPMDELNRQLMTAVIAKILNPADPIENFAKMVAAMKGLPGFTASDGKAGIALELVRQIPTVTQNLVQITQAWQMGQEAQARTVALSRGGSQPIPLTPMPQHAAPPANVIPISAPHNELGTGAAAPPPAPPVTIEVPQMPIETLEQMLCNIIADAGLTVEQAANEACALIERSMPGMTDQMISKGEEWLLGLFSNRPVLQQVANHPRLAEFVKKFIEVVKAAPIMQAANPSAPVA